MKIVTVVGARPQFIKAAVVSRELRQVCEEILVHTGQHYDTEMSDIFFSELNIPQPNHFFHVGSGLPGWQTAKMIMYCEETFITERPDWVLVYGDTNSTLAAALAAVKLSIPLAHVEAGLRSFNREMPEEHNRILTDHCASLLLCPTQNAMNLLRSEGIEKGIYNVGDVMFDAVLQHGEVAMSKSDILNILNVKSKDFILATIHRPYNTDNVERLSTIFQALAKLECPVVFPLHPRTAKAMELATIVRPENIVFSSPLGYLDMLAAEQHSRLIITDSGGVQKEAYFFRIPCVTLRPETEWIETVETGCNKLCWGGVTEIVQAVRGGWDLNFSGNIFGEGTASRKIVNILKGQDKPR